MTARYDPARDSLDDIDTGEHIRQRPGPKPNPAARRTVPRVKMSAAEWASVQRMAKDAGATNASAWVREKCGL